MKEGGPDRLHGSSYLKNILVMHLCGERHLVEVYGHDGRRKQELGQKKGDWCVGDEDRTRSRQGQGQE